MAQEPEELMLGRAPLPKPCAQATCLPSKVQEELQNHLGVGPGHWQRSGTSDPGVQQAPRCPLRVWEDLALRLGPVYPQHRSVPS